jgi:hypothetical protein
MTVLVPERPGPCLARLLDSAAERESRGPVQHLAHRMSFVLPEIAPNGAREVLLGRRKYTLTWVGTAGFEPATPGL